MGQEDRRAEPLLQAIHELRAELLGWIDARLETLRQREVVGGSTIVRAPVLRETREAACSPSRGTPESAEPPEARSNGDARRRLDDLARQLGERLRHAEPPGAGAGPAQAAPAGVESDRNPGRS